MTWTTADIGSLAGRSAVVTGPSLGGIGYATALELARAGSRVVLAGRTPAKLAEAAAAIRTVLPGAVTEQVVLDVASLASVRDAASVIAQFGPLDLLVNNAGVMATPYARTVDGLERQLATNHFGPFLLTGLLLPSLAASGHGRVVTVSSIGHHGALSAPVGDPYAEPSFYRANPVYFQTKLANLLFTYELDRRLRATGTPIRALAAHPGFAHTHLITNGSSYGPLSGIADKLYPLVAQTPAQGARPTLMAATADLPGGTFVGPRWLQLQGAPQVVGSSKLSHNADAARRLWQLSEQTTEVKYP